MFSFFKRAKKDSEHQNGSPAKEKKTNKVKSITQNDNNTATSPTVAPKEPYKNKSEYTLSESGNNKMVPNTVPESRLPQQNSTIPLSAKTSDDEVTAKNPPIKLTLKPNNSGAMEVHVNNNTCDDAKISITLPNVTSYANMVKNDAQQRRSCVKPCGHGVVAIAPKIPLPNQNTTPPNSPELKLGARPKYRRVRSYEHSPSQKEGSHELKNGKKHHLDDPVSDTVKATMKLKFDLPPTPSPNNRKNVLLNGTQDEHEKKNLINQEAKFQSQLNDVSKQLSLRDAEANKLRFQMEELQRDVFAKSAGMDRLQAELQAVLKESECMRQRLRHVEDDLQNTKQRNSDLSEEVSVKTDRFNDFQSTANAKIADLQATIRGLRAKIEALEIQLEMLEKEKENLEKQRAGLIQQREDDKKTLEESLEKAIQDKLVMEQKFETDFEKIRTVNIVKEQELLNDFEWKLREIEQSCKKRLQDKDKRIEEELVKAYEDAEKKIKQAEDIMKEVENLKSFECEVRQLRGLTLDQQKSLDVIAHQLEEMKKTEQALRSESQMLKNLVDVEKENLKRMQKIHNNELLDKERKLKQTMHEQKTAIASYWEDKLLQECRRLKSELAQLHYEDRSEAIKTIKAEKEHVIDEMKQKYEKKIQECLQDVANLMKSLKEKDEYYYKQLEISQTNSDRETFELRRVMDKIDMSHHERFEKLVQEHERELEKINKEHEKQIREIEGNWQLQVSSMRTTVELVKEQMEKESQQKLQMLIKQHRSELDEQWQNLIHQKSEAIRLVEDEYVTKYKTLEEQFHTQKKSHESREVELLKTIDSLKNEITTKDSTIEDLQNNVDTLEGGIQVLNQEMAFHGETVTKTQLHADHKIRELQEAVNQLQDQRDKEREDQQLHLNQIHKQSQETIDHLQRKYQCLNKLFDEVRARYERRESRQEDLNVIADLRQVIAEQEKDLACLNEEKRYFQIKLISLERFLEDQSDRIRSNSPEIYTSTNSSMTLSNQCSIPPTIHECDDDFEDAVD